MELLPVLTQHFRMLFRNLLYTGLMRARQLVVFVGTRKALAMAVKNQDTELRRKTHSDLFKKQVYNQSGLDSMRLLQAVTYRCFKLIEAGIEAVRDMRNIFSLDNVQQK